ncbi:division/cell wall cluster transcriptional repressor MraZ [Marinihelvus fidelis]|uniref:division/cell wall cluster transcriptional repressor MraZ n=1 Tax=Marinihelvus fidelis TaxID=2613842 RepID=UPI00178532A8|nr:division/cell wall cluster transcriptional repressor MraZ [Marinihelvus fidelis]
MYFGETAINLDAKGRIAIPTRYRDDIAAQDGGQMVLTYSAFDSGVLWLSPREHWESMRDQVMSLSTFDAAHRGLQRRLVGSATPVEPDGSFRIQLPQTLRQVAGLEKKAVLMGIGKRFEIWNENVLNQQRADEERSLADTVSEEMRGLVL